MSGASPRPPRRRLLRGQRQARRCGRSVQGIRSLEPPARNRPIPVMRAPRQPAMEGGGSVRGRGRIGSTWNACGPLSGLSSADDRQRFARRDAAATASPASCKRVRGAARRSPWPAGAKGRRLRTPREDLLARSRSVVRSAARPPAMPVLEGVVSPRAVHGGAFARAHVEVELLATRVRAQQGECVSTPHARLLGIASDVRGGARSTWNVYGDVWPRAGDIPRGHALGGRISGQRKTVEAAAGPRIPA
jgi:hypothetical protein